MSSDEVMTAFALIALVLENLERHLRLVALAGAFTSLALAGFAVILFLIGRRLDALEDAVYEDEDPGPEEKVAPRPGCDFHQLPAPSRRDAA